MSGYTEVSKELLKDIENLINKGENTYISEFVKLKGNLYREIIIKKKSLGVFREEVSKKIYINKNNKEVKEKNITKELSQHFYYYRILFDDSAKHYILKTIRDEGAVQKEKYEYELCLQALDFLQDEKVDNTAIVKTIMGKTLITREQNNESLKKLSEIVKEIKQSQEYFNEDDFNRAYPLYIEILKLNFESIKNIAQGIKYYDDIQKAANKKRRALAIRFNRKLFEPLYKLDYQISYYKRLLRTYDSVINMSMSQYLKVIEDRN